MRIAIIGSGPLAAEAALRFDQLGAQVKAFSEFNWLERVQAFSALNANTNQEYWNELLAKLEASDVQFLKCSVKRIHKTRLTPKQTLPAGRSRLIDMFRIVVSEDPTQGVLQQVDENPEVFEKLGEDVLASLHESMETFYDVDLVIACFDELFEQPGLTNSGALALNEKRLESQITTLKNIWLNKLSSGEALLVGGNDEVLDACARLTSKLTQVDIEGESTHSLLWQEVCSMADSEWDVGKTTYQQKLHEWRALEDYMRAKVPAPNEPVRRIDRMTDASVIAVDRLLDREGLFVSIEFGQEHDVITRAVKSIVNARAPRWRKDAFEGLALTNGYPQLTITSEEPGFYALGMEDKKVWNPHVSLQELEEIEADIMRWFKPAGDE